MWTVTAYWNRGPMKTGPTPCFGMARLPTHRHCGAEPWKRQPDYWAAAVTPRSQQCCVEKDRATSALRSRLRTGDGSYVDYRSNGFASTRLSLDSSLLVGFHLVDDAVQLLGNLESLKGRHGISVI